MASLGIRTQVNRGQGVDLGCQDAAELSGTAHTQLRPLSTSRNSVKDAEMSFLQIPSLSVHFDAEATPLRKQPMEALEIPSV